MRSAQASLASQVSFALLHRDPGNPAEVIAHLRELTGFSADQVTPL